MIETKLRYADDTEDMGDFPLREGLSWRARKDAEIQRAMGRGTELIYGDRGGGKDLYAYAKAYLHKHYFNRPILFDEPPKKGFGEYIPFDANVMMKEIRKMAKKAGVEGIEGTKDQEEYDQFVEQETVKWATEGEGHMLLKNAVLYLAELKRYCPKREPHNRFNRFIGSLNTIVRHMDMLIMGTHVFPNEIDEYTYMQYANIRTKCEWCVSEPHTTKAKVSMQGMIGADFAYGSNIVLKPFYYYVNGKEPRSSLNGEGFFTLFQSKNFVNLIPVAPKEV